MSNKVLSIFESRVGTAFDPLRRMRGLPANGLGHQPGKRALDIALIVAALPLLLPVLLLIAAIVKLTSPGPVFFSHRRIRRYGDSFSMWKFRTMCVDANEVMEHHLARYPAARMEWDRTQKLKADPRITPVGRLLRRYSLDELPQVWNVLLGQMSLVGPRPIVAVEMEKYGELFAFYCRVQPGITGLWQVSGRSRLTYAQRVRLDCDYVLQWTLLTDCWLLLRTIVSVVNRDGAY